MEGDGPFWEFSFFDGLVNECENGGMPHVGFDPGIEFTHNRFFAF